jgi:hypothetical protein
MQIKKYQLLLTVMELLKLRTISDSLEV